MHEHPTNRRRWAAALLVTPLLFAFLVAAKPEDTGGPVTCYLPAVVEPDARLGGGPLYVVNVEGHGAVSASDRNYTCHAKYAAGDSTTGYDGSGAAIPGGDFTIADFTAHCGTAAALGGDCDPGDPRAQQARIDGSSSPIPCTGITADGLIFPDGTQDYVYKLNRNGNYSLRCSAES